MTGSGNTFTVANVIQKLNRPTLVISHNKKTIARADALYGVTMEEFGVSKPVGMRLTDSESTKGKAKTAAQKAAEKLDA